MSSRALLVSLGLVALAGCSDEAETQSGQPLPTSVTQTIDETGGTITLAGATVTFPSGAVQAAESITISATDEAAPEGFMALSRIYRCEPSGLDFDPRVIMAMEFEADGVVPTMFWSSGDDPSFQDVGGTVDDEILSAPVAHFSRGFVGHVHE